MGGLERQKLKAEKGMECGVILEIADGRSAKGKIGAWSAERQDEKRSEHSEVMSKKVRVTDFPLFNKIL